MSVLYSPCDKETKAREFVSLFSEDFNLFSLFSSLVDMSILYPVRVFLNSNNLNCNQFDKDRLYKLFVEEEIQLITTYDEAKNKLFEQF